MELLGRLLLEGLTTGSRYAIVAMGFSLIWWVTATVHVAHGGVVLVTAYALYFLVKVAHVRFLLAVPAAAVVAVALGLLVEYALYKPLRRKGSGEMTVLTASLGGLIILENVLSIVAGQDIRLLESDFLRETQFSVAGVGVDYYASITLATTAGLFALVIALMAKTRVGKGMRALAANDELARVVGLDVERLKTLCVVVGSALIVPAAALIVYDTGVVPDLGMHTVLVAAVVTIFGGMGSVAAALVGGLVIGLAESLMVWRFTAGWQDVVTFVILYFVLLLRPQGLFGARPSG